MTLTLETAERLANVALSEGRAQAFAPLSVVVTDPGGHVIIAKRDDGAGILRVDIAHGKAWGALGMGFGTREIARRAEVMPAFVTAIAATSGGRIVPSPGGVLIFDESRLVGAIGISGDTGDNDEMCALAAISSVGLATGPGSGVTP